MVEIVAASPANLIRSSTGTLSKLFIPANRASALRPSIHNPFNFSSCLIFSAVNGIPLIGNKLFQTVRYSSQPFSRNSSSCFPPFLRSSSVILRFEFTTSSNLPPFTNRPAPGKPFGILVCNRSSILLTSATLPAFLAADKSPASLVITAVPASVIFAASPALIAAPISSDDLAATDPISIIAESRFLVIGSTVLVNQSPSFFPILPNSMLIGQVLNRASIPRPIPVASFVKNATTGFAPVNNCINF